MTSIEAAQIAAQQQWPRGVAGYHVSLTVQSARSLKVPGSSPGEVISFASLELFTARIWRRRFIFFAYPPKSFTYSLFA